MNSVQNTVLFIKEYCGKFTASKKYEVSQAFSKSAEWFLKDHVTFVVMIAENSTFPSQE